MYQQSHRKNKLLQVSTQNCRFLELILILQNLSGFVSKRRESADNAVLMDLRQHCITSVHSYKISWSRGHAFFFFASYSIGCGFFSVPAAKCWDSTLCQTTTISFQIPSSSSVMNQADHSTHQNVQLLQASLNKPNINKQGVHNFGTNQGLLYGQLDLQTLQCYVFTINIVCLRLAVLGIATHQFHHFTSSIQGSLVFFYFNCNVQKDLVTSTARVFGDKGGEHDLDDVYMQAGEELQWRIILVVSLCTPPFNVILYVTYT